jgi:4-amino-4-deoxy-L-arabinose transferase-like glycosyltransferase
MTIADLGGAVLGPLDRLAAALVDPSRRERTAVQLLIGYVAVWTLYGVLAKGSQDVHFDMGEAVAWSREPAFGYSKHPPLSAWVVRAWFTMFPLADWAYYLLAMVLAGLALWIAWMLSARWLEGEKRAAGLALLTLVPFFNFHALKFNANTVLIPLWAATTLWFLRSFEARDPLSAALAGVAAAAAMLGKYWSIVLLGGLAIAALGDPRRSAYFRSPAPWVTAAAGLLVLAPHVAWLFSHHFEPFGYAVGLHQAAGFSASAADATKFLVGAMAYVAVPVILGSIAMQPSLAALFDTLWPTSADRRFAAVAFWAPFAIAVSGALAAKMLITSLWTMSMFTLLPVVLMSSPRLVMPRKALVRLLAITTTFPIVMALAAPAVAFFIHRNGVPGHGSHYRLLAEAVEQAWRETSRAPLALVGSDVNLASGMAFYLPVRVTTLNVLDRRTSQAADRINEQGIALVCASEETDCMNAVAALASRLSRGKRSEIELARNYLGVAGKPERYSIITVPPQF